MQYLIQARLASIADQWEFLTQKTTEKSLKLKEANKQRTYIAAVKDLDFWLGEVKLLNEISIKVNKKLYCMITKFNTGRESAHV